MTKESEDVTLFEHHPSDARVREVDVCPTLTTQMDNQSDLPLIQSEYKVRRLTPEECERLQGFPTGYTRIPWKGKPEANCPDAPRYKAIGNSWAVPVVQWIGKRIQEEFERSRNAKQ